ncbi:hypothetical protein F2P56_017071, partial [Juglans regia]
MKIFTCRWLPANKEPKALIFICHGYAMECSITMNSTATRLVKAGFAVYGIDYEGHGKSGGLAGYVNNFDDVAVDCSDHFTTICGQILLISLSIYEKHGYKKDFNLIPHVKHMWSDFR